MLSNSVYIEPTVELSGVVPMLTAMIVKLYCSINSLSSTLLTVISPLLLSIINESVNT